MYGNVWLCMAMYGYVWQCMAMYGNYLNQNDQEHNYSWRRGVLFHGQIVDVLHVRPFLEKYLIKNPAHNPFLLLGGGHINKAFGDIPDEMIKFWMFFIDFKN